MNYRSLALLGMVLTGGISGSICAQSEKRVVQNEQIWVGLHGQYRWNEHWGVMADVHHRRFEFSEIPGVYVARAALSYRIKGSSTVAAGGALFSILHRQEPKCSNGGSINNGFGANP